MEKTDKLRSMKNIIVPLDFSMDSLKGLELAILIAHKTPVAIQMVYVQKKTDVPSLAEEEFRYAEKNLKRILVNMLSRITPKKP